MKTTKDIQENKQKNIVHKKKPKKKITEKKSKTVKKIKIRRNHSPR